MKTINRKPQIRKSKDGIGFIRITDLQEEMRDTFDEWLFDYTRPLIEEEEDFFGCAYPADYERFLKSVIGIPMKPEHQPVRASDMTVQEA